MVARLLLVLALLVAACGDAAVPDAAPVATTEAPVELPADFPATTVPGQAVTPATPSPPPVIAGGEPALVTDFDGPAVPDFALPLENQAGAFVLSEAAAPVYLTFWAEW